MHVFRPLLWWRTGHHSHLYNCLGLQERWRYHRGGPNCPSIHRSLPRAWVSSRAFQQRGWGLWGNAALSWQTWPPAMTDAQWRHTTPRQSLREHHRRGRQFPSFAASVPLSPPLSRAEMDDALPRSCHFVCTAAWIIRASDCSIQTHQGKVFTASCSQSRVLFCP